MNDRDCENCIHRTQKGCNSWDCNFERRMTNEEAIRIAQGLITDFKCESETMVDFCNVVIKALKKEPCVDAISRQAVQDYIAKYLSQYLYNDVRESVEVIDEYIGELPSVTPQPKTGHWIKISPADIYECSECGQNVMTADICAYRYCHGCGAKMEESEGEHG